MFDLLDRMYVMIICGANAFLKDEDGAVDLVTIVVLIGIAVVLAAFFRQQIKSLLDTLFGLISGNAINAVQGE